MTISVYNNGMKKTKPRTVRSVVDMIIQYMPTKDKQYLKGLPRTKLIRLHDTLGRYIRNTFEMWGKNHNLLKDCLKIQRNHYKEDYESCKKHYGKKKIRIIHPDDASLVVIQELWKRLQA
jgi:hypothetical protein